MKGPPQFWVSQGWVTAAERLAVAGLSTGVEPQGGPTPLRGEIGGDMVHALEALDLGVVQPPDQVDLTAFLGCPRSIGVGSFWEMNLLKVDGLGQLAYFSLEWRLTIVFKMLFLW